MLLVDLLVEWMSMDAGLRRSAVEQARSTHWGGAEFEVTIFPERRRAYITFVPANASVVRF